MKEALNIIEYKGYKIKIYPDEYNSPREWDNFTELHCWHKKINLGDENYYLYNESDKDKLYNMLQESKKNRDIILPLYFYQHSGIILSLSNTEYPFNDCWDAGQIGYVIVRRKKILNEFSAKILHKGLQEKALKLAKTEIKVYNQYLIGDVYGYMLEKNEENIDGCWGFYGIEDCITEAKNIIDYYIKKEKKEMLPFPEEIKV